MVTQPGRAATVDLVRAAMADVPTAVSVVTTLAADGQPYGTTVSAFMSLSMKPPTLLVSLDNTSTLLSRLGRGSVAGINVLSVQQTGTASRFATKHEDKFSGLAWENVDGAPRLPDAHAWITVSVTEFVRTGDHTLVLGTVDTASLAGGAPLIYWQRTYGTHTAA